MDVNEDVEFAVDTDNVDDEDDNFIRYDIATYPSDLTLRGLKDMWDSGDVQIPGFQRNFVWTIKQASLLIESFLLGLPVPQAFFFIDDEHNNLVIDGQQRITSIVMFIDGYFGAESARGKKQVFRLTGLSPKSPFLKKTFADLEDADRRKLLGSVLRVVNIRQMAPQRDGSAAFHIFERLNTGGTPLRPQEIRNCVFHGPIVDALNELNELPQWREILGRPNKDKHQRDVEILLRVFAMFSGWERYEKPMKEFLNSSMQKNRSASSKSFTTFREIFPGVCKEILSTLGEKPFHVRGPINLAALDVVMTTWLRNREKNPEELADRYKLLVKDEKFRELIFFNTSDAVTVAGRMKMMR